MDRHARQSRLEDVGVGGQTRIGRASVELHLDGFAGEVAARYLAGAGVGRVRVLTSALAATIREIDSGVVVDVGIGVDLEPRLPDTLGLHDPVARDLGGGALCALRALRSALQGVVPALGGQAPKLRPSSPPDRPDTP